MKPRQGRTLLSLYAVDVFLDANEHRLPKTCATGMRIRFKRALAEVELHVQVQAGAPLMAMGLTSAKDAKREALIRDHMAPIARIAKLEAGAFPALAPIKMPRGAPGTAKLLAHAAGMASMASDYRDVFIASGMRPSFIEDLQSAIDDIVSTISARSERRGARAGATRGLVVALKNCAAYKAVLASFIETEARDDLPFLANWRAVQRIGRGSRRRRTLVAPTPTIVAAHRSLTAPALPIRDIARLLPAPRPGPEVAARSSRPMPSDGAPILVGSVQGGFQPAKTQG
jgi:hypothetical protein